MGSPKIKQRLLDEVARIRSESLDDLDMSVQCSWAVDIAKKRVKNRFGDFERKVKELLDEDGNDGKASDR